MSSIAGMTLFDSGPHRFSFRQMGTLFVPPLTIDNFQTKISVVDSLELRIVQTGRLVAGNDDDLRSLTEAIRFQAEAQLRGTLVENAGNSWSNMTLLKFTPADRIDRNWKVSVGYRVDYARLAV